MWRKRETYQQELRRSESYRNRKWQHIKHNSELDNVSSKWSTNMGLNFEFTESIVSLKETGNQLQLPWMTYHHEPRSDVGKIFPHPRYWQQNAERCLSVTDSWRGKFYCTVLPMATQILFAHIQAYITHITVLLLLIFLLVYLFAAAFNQAQMAANKALSYRKLRLFSLISSYRPINSKGSAKHQSLGNWFIIVEILDMHPLRD